MSVPAPPEVARALDACYDALVLPETWSEALHALAQSVGANGCMFRAKDAERDILDLPMSPGLHEFMDAFVREGWWRDDHRAKRGWPLMVARGGGVLLDHDLATEEELRRLPLCNEISRDYDLPWWAGAGFSVGGHHWIMALLRDSRRGPFTAADAERLGPLIPHFRRLVGFAERIAASEAQAGMQTLDLVGAPAILLDGRGLVVCWNAAAEPVMRSGFKINRGRLVARHRASDPAFQALVALTTAPNASRDRLASDPVAIHREARRPLLVEAMPVSGLFADMFQHFGAILLLTDPDSRPVSDAARLRQAFGLTHAEAHLAARLVAGEDLRAAADALGITKGTARSQLKSVFAKTGTHRQAELVAVLGRLGDRP